MITGSSHFAVYDRPEAAGLQEAPGDVVGEVAEAEGGAAEVFEPAVEGLGRAVAGAGPVEVGEHVAGPLVQGATEPPQLDQSGRGRRRGARR